MKSELTSPSGRRRAPEDLARFLNTFQRSGLTQHQYARQLGMGYSTLTKWLRRARQMPRAHPAPSPVEFLAVHPIPPPGGPAYQLRWPGGFSLHLARGFDPQEVRHLLSLLPPCSP